jgi:hypothetical protein
MRHRRDERNLPALLSRLKLRPIRAPIAAAGQQGLHQAGEAAAWGTPQHVADRITVEAEKIGAGTILVSMNRGAMPQEMFLNQIHRFATEVLPRLQRHAIVRVPLAEAGMVG